MQMLINCLDPHARNGLGLNLILDNISPQQSISEDVYNLSTNTDQSLAARPQG